MKNVFKSLILLTALTLSLSVMSCKEGTKDKIEAAGEAAVEDTKEAAEKAGDAVSEAAKDAAGAVDKAVDKTKDALVGGTEYNATGKIPCSMGDDQPSGTCDFGVVREGNGTGMVTVTRPDGVKHVIFFENGKATGYDQSEADPGEFKATKESDMSTIHIGEERYEIPDAVIYGG